MSPSDYLAHYIPRRSGGNFTGGTTPLHLESREACSAEDPCSSNSLLMLSITTHWPQILSISALKRMHNDAEGDNKSTLIYPLSMDIVDIDGLPVTYELVGRQVFVNNNHFVSQICLGNHTFAYDDMKGGNLKDLGPASLVTESNPGNFCYVYHRMSEKCTVCNFLSMPCILLIQNI